MAPAQTLFLTLLAFSCSTATAFDEEAVKKHREAAKIGAIFVCEGCDLARVDFEGAYLVEARLAGADLSNANLKRANLLGILLPNANLAGAVLSGEVDARGADMSGSDLSKADLSDI